MPTLEPLPGAHQRHHQTLAENENEDAVTHMRHLFQKAMETDYTNAIERLTGHKVVAFISGNNTSPDVASELFILDSPLYPSTPGHLSGGTA
jgi:uncharacterized protein YbcI